MKVIAAKMLTIFILSNLLEKTELKSFDFSS